MTLIDPNRPAPGRAPVRRFLRAAGPWLFLSPALLILGLWFFRPFLQNVFYSFTSWNLLPTSSPVPVGFRNYLFLFEHPDFGRALVNTLWYILGMIPFSIVLPLLLAVATEHIGKVPRTVYRALLFVPMIVPPVTVSAIWQWLFHPTNGLINACLHALGLTKEPVFFLTDERFAMASIVLIAGWKMIGFSTIMFAAALTGIDKSYYEAASLDRASRLRQTFTITLPLVSPMVLFLLMVSLLFTAQWTFAYINVLTQGGPAGATTNVYYLMYVYGLKNFNIGMSSAAALTFFVVFGVLALILTAINKRFAFHDN